MESEGSKEKGSGGGSPTSGKMTLQRAVQLGEYDPVYLSRFDDWSSLSPHVQFQLVRQGLDNRNKQLLQHWALLNNTLDRRLKPEIQEAMDAVFQKLRQLEKDRERLYLEYSK